MSGSAQATLRRFGRSRPEAPAVDGKEANGESTMTETVKTGKRDFLKAAALVGVASGALSASTGGPALAQMLETGVRDDSVLAKIRKEGVLRVGYAQTGPWFYKDAKTGELGGSCKDVVDQLCRELQIKAVQGGHVRELDGRA